MPHRYYVWGSGLIWRHGKLCNAMLSYHGALSVEIHTAFCSKSLRCQSKSESLESLLSQSHAGSGEVGTICFLQFSHAQSVCAVLCHLATEVELLYSGYHEEKSLPLQPRHPSSFHKAMTLNVLKTNIPGSGTMFCSPWQTLKCTCKTKFSFLIAAQQVPHLPSCKSTLKGPPHQRNRLHAFMEPVPDTLPHTGHACLTPDWTSATYTCASLCRNSFNGRYPDSVELVRTFHPRQRVRSIM